MATVTLYKSSGVGDSPSCGSWVSTYPGLVWNADSCSTSASATGYENFAHSIPVGSVITAIGGTVNGYTSVTGLGAVGELLLYVLGFTTTLNPLTFTRTAADYGFTVTAGLPYTLTSSADLEAQLSLLNNESFYACSHYATVTELNVTYTPPASSNLFFGSTF